MVHRAAATQSVGRFSPYRLEDCQSHGSSRPTSLLDRRGRLTAGAGPFVDVVPLTAEPPSLAAGTSVQLRVAIESPMLVGVV